MSFEPSETALPANVDIQLDQLLGEWRNHHQLAPVQVAKIRQAILETPSEFSAAGWVSYVNYLNRSLARANYYPQRFVRPRAGGTTSHYQSPPPNIVQLRITPDWQPYLKLA